MLSELSQAMIVNGAVWGAVLATDLGPARKVGVMRIVRPLVVAAVIVPLFVAKPATHGMSLVLEITGIIAGALCGLAAIALMRVYRSPETGKPVSRAGWGYATLWTVVIGARALFSYGSVHWWPTQLVHWGIAHQVTAGRAHRRARVHGDRDARHPYPRDLGPRRVIVRRRRGRALGGNRRLAFLTNTFVRTSQSGATHVVAPLSACMGWRSTAPTSSARRRCCGAPGIRTLAEHSCP